MKYKLRSGRIWEHLVGIGLSHRRIPSYQILQRLKVDDFSLSTTRIPVSFPLRDLIPLPAKLPQISSARTCRFLLLASTAQPILHSRSTETSAAGFRDLRLSRFIRACLRGRRRPSQGVTPSTNIYQAVFGEAVRASAIFKQGNCVQEGMFGLCGRIWPRHSLKLVDRACSCTSPQQVPQSSTTADTVAEFCWYFCLHSYGRALPWQPECSTT